MDDRISELPDCILSHILTMLSTKDVLKTSVLSTRWCKLWTLTRDLHFDIFHVLGTTPEQLLQIGQDLDSKSRSNIVKRRRAHIDNNVDEFIKRVDHFINNFPSIKMDSFFVNFYSDGGKNSNIIDQWITFAIARGVETINLSLLPISTAFVKRYKFAFDLLFSDATNASTLKHLRLQHCLLCCPTKCNYIPFKNLRSLLLYRAKADEIFIESLLSNCPLLEKLYLLNCEFRSSMPKIVSSSLCQLKVGTCYVSTGNFQMYMNLTSLDCLKLTSFDYCIGPSFVTFNMNTPLLKSIRCSFVGCVDPNELAFFATLPKLEIMKLDFYSMVHDSLKITQPLKHLKQLSVILFSPFSGTVKYSNFNLFGILTLLRAAPRLYKLSVMVTHPNIIENQKLVEDIDMCSHDEIKVIELRGCVGNRYEIEFVMNVLKYAHKLEKIVLSPYWRENESLDWKFDLVWFQNRRQMIRKKLQSANVVGLEKLVLI